MNAPFSTTDRPRLVTWDAKRQAIDYSKDVYRLAILALPGFSQLSLSSFVEPLRLANSISGRKFFEWTLASPDGSPAECSSGFHLSVDNDFSNVGHIIQANKGPNLVVVCSGEGVEKQTSASVINVLRLGRRYRVPIAALGTATWLLAECGMLEDTACTIHWDKLDALSETFGRVQATDRLYVRGPNLMTCAGGLASFDLVMELICDHLGREIADAVCQHAIARQWRSGSDRQGAAGVDTSGICKRLAEVIRIMEEHIEDPLPLRDIAKCVGRSTRQIERLFARSVSSPPMRYYLHLRLGRAKRLLEQTDLPVVEIAIACGFASSSNFSKCFREAFGAVPRACRKRSSPRAKAGTSKTTSLPATYEDAFAS